MKTWINIGGVDCPCRLTATQIVYTVVDGEQFDYGSVRPWSGEGRFRVSFGGYTPESVRNDANGWPKGGQLVSSIHLDAPDAWPACSDNVRAWLTKCADAVRLRREREAKERRIRDAARQREAAIASAARALLEAAKTGDDVAILAAAMAYFNIAKESSDAR